MIDCRLQSRGLIENIIHERPKVPRNLEEKCNNFIKTWSEETFQQTLVVETNKSGDETCEEDSIAFTLANSDDYRLVNNISEEPKKKMMSFTL